MELLPFLKKYTGITSILLKQNKRIGLDWTNNNNMMQVVIIIIYAITMDLTHCFKVQPHPLPQVYTNYNVNIEQIDASFNFISAMNKSFLVRIKIGLNFECRDDSINKNNTIKKSFFVN